MLENLPEGQDLPKVGGGHLNPKVASVKMGGADNHAYAGLPQGDDPSVLNRDGVQPVEDQDTRYRLESYLQGVWESATQDRETNGIDEELLNCLRQFKGEYDANEKAAFALSQMPPVYFPLSEHKVHTGVAWLDEFFTDGVKVVNLKPTPVPELEDDIVAETVRQANEDIAIAVQQTGAEPNDEMRKLYAAEKRNIVEQQFLEMARQRALRMEKVVHDDMIQGGWGAAMHDLIGYAAIYGTGGFRSPVIRTRRELAWDTKAGKLVKRERVVRSFEAISPFDLFPSPGMTDTQEGDLCIRVRYQPHDLSSMRNNPLWIPDAIDEVLSLHGQSGIRLDVGIDTERRTLTAQTSHKDTDKVLEGFEFWGGVSGAMLTEIGITETPERERIADSDSEWYEVNAVVIASRVVYCRVMKDAEDRPVDVVKYYDTPGSFFGRGPLQIMSSLQRICNAAGRSIVVNMGFASGPQAIIDVTQIHPADDKKLRPLKAWLLKRGNVGASNLKPIEFFQPESNAKTLFEVFSDLQRLADELTGIPAYANGTDAATGAARTATGLNMLFGAANRGIKEVIGHFDEIVKRAVKRLFMWHMEYNRDEAIKGDVNIEVNGLKMFVTKTAQANDRLTLLRTISQDQRMAGLQPDEGLARQLRDIAVAFDAPPDDFAPDANELARIKAERQREAEAAAIQQQQMVAEERQAKLDEIQAGANAKAAAQGGGEGLTPTGRPDYPDRPPNEGGLV